MAAAEASMAPSTNWRRLVMRYLLLNGEMKKHARQTACEQHGNNAHLETKECNHRAQRNDQRGGVQTLRDRNIHNDTRRAQGLCLR